MAGPDIQLVDVGACTSIGRGAFESAAAVRAKVAGFAQHPFMVDSIGLPMRAAIACWLDIDLPAVERMVALAGAAVEEAMQSLAEASAPALRVGLYIGVPLSRPGFGDGAGEAVVKRILQRFANVFSDVRAVRGGHAAGLQAQAMAIDQLRAGAVEAAVVAGVDSLLSPETLEWIEACDQLHGAGPYNNAWGYIPGEGAGALLLTTARGGRLAAGPLGRVVSSALAIERNQIKTDTVCIGEGLTDALRAMLQGLPRGELVTDVYCDMNGEPYRADEYGFAGLRVSESFVSLSDFVAPADCWGDVGAASGPLLLVLAAVAGHKGYANGRHACVWCSSEQGERAAALLTVGEAA